MSLLTNKLITKATQGLISGVGRELLVEIQGALEEETTASRFLGWAGEAMEQLGAELADDAEAVKAEGTGR